MARVFTFLILATGMMLLFTMAGVPTAVNSILDWLGLTATGQNVSASQFFIAIGAVFALATVSGIIIGTFSRASPESYILAPLCAALLIFVGTFVSVINYTQSNSPGWIAGLMLLLFGPIVIGYVLSLVEFWRGTA